MKNNAGKKKEKRQAKERKSAKFVECMCKPKKSRKKKPRKNLNIHGTAHDTNRSTNPYLNYFRQFYSKRGGKVIEAAKEAGANWRKMSSDEKSNYRSEGKKKSQRIYYSRIRKLNRIFRLLTPKTKSTPVKSEQILKVKSMLQGWTHKIYMEVSGLNSMNKANGAANKSVWIQHTKANGKENGIDNNKRKK